jgi:hypothetical protein
MADANGTTGGKPDATPMKFQHPTGIPCTVAGATTEIEPVAPPRHDGTHVEEPREHGVEPVPGDHDELCTDQDVWEAELQACPEDALCTSCVWGS